MADARRPANDDVDRGSEGRQLIRKRLIEHMEEASVTHPNADLIST